MNDRILQHYLDEFELGAEVEAAEAETLFDALTDCDDPALIAKVLAAWNSKGVTEDELFAMADLMRSRMKRIRSRYSCFVDIVGTGGGASKSFNISTAAAFVIAGTGLAVAKHGNRAATSKCGSADVLSTLGVEIDVEPAVSEQNLNDHGLCFMFAPRFHSLSPSLAAARRAIGRPTIFNNLGPLCNPALAPHSVIGVWDKHMLETTANVLKRLGARKSWVVYGEGGLDEIALKGGTLVAEIDDGEINVFEISASDFDVFTLGKDIPSACTPEESSAMITSVLKGEQKGRDPERLVLINAAAALFVAGRSLTLSEAYAKAEESVRNGNALSKLNIMKGATGK